MFRRVHKTVKRDF